MLFINDATAQVNINGKIYVAEISSTCKLMENGGCSICTYCILTFQKDKVIISYRTKANCTEKGREAGYESNNNNEKKIYKWIMKGDSIHIQNFTIYGDLKLEHTILVGKIEKSKWERLEFIEERIKIKKKANK